MWGCGRTSSPWPAPIVAGPIWSKNTKGPTMRRSCEGRMLLTVNPSPRSRGRPVKTVSNISAMSNERWAHCRPTPSGLRLADVVALAELHAVVAQDVVGRGDVEIEIGQRLPEQVLHAGPGDVAARALDGDLLVLAAVELRGLDRLDEGDRLGDALFQLGERLLRVLVLRDLDAGETRDRGLRGIARGLHLAREREHVGKEAVAHERR